MSGVRLAAVTTLLALFSCVSHGQTAAPAVEVASIKPNAGGRDAPMAVRPQQDRLTIVNVPVLQLIQMAYRVDRRDIKGAPEWVANEHYDITAKASAPFTADNRWESMLRTLVIERFKLKAHTEQGPADVYELVKARADGKLGPNLRPADTDCGAEIRAGRIPAGTQNPCGAADLGNAPLTGLIKVQGLDLNGALVPFLEMELKQRVVNATGLSGPFDIDLSWTPLMYLNAPPTVRPDVDRTRPTVLDALPEQLGLKLVKKTSSVDVLVVDHVERPTPD